MNEIGEQNQVDAGGGLKKLVHQFQSVSGSALEWFQSANVNDHGKAKKVYSKDLEDWVIFKYDRENNEKIPS